jgi:hypothetical protein
MDISYLTPGVMTGLGRHAAAVAGLPGDLAGIVRVVQGLFLHELWAPVYGVTLPGPAPESVHRRRAADMLDAVSPELTTADLLAGRPADRRVVTICRGFTVLTVALLRAHGVAARARCGFGTYFRPGMFEDHWVVEYRVGGTWRLADAQLDEVQREKLGVDFDTLDMPRDAFVFGPDAWRMVRDGVDPARFGLGDNLSGTWLVAGNVLRDLAAQANMEPLAWDVWPPMPDPDGPVDTALIDRIAAGAVAVSVPDQVYNAIRNRMEPFT